MKNCEHDEQQLIRETEWRCNGKTYTLETCKCCECGAYIYGYNGWQKKDWQSIDDVKNYLRKL